MGKKFIIIIILIAQTSLLGQSLFELLSPQPEFGFLTDNYDNDYVTTGYINYNLIDLSGSEGEKKYIKYREFFILSSIDTPYFTVKTEIKLPRLEMYINNLDTIDDYFELTRDEEEFNFSLTGDVNLFILKAGLFYSNSFGGNAGLGLNVFDGVFEFNYSYRPNYNRFNYNVGDEKGSIDFDYSNTKKSLKFTHEKFKYELYDDTIFTIENDDRIHSKIYGSIQGVNLWFMLYSFPVDFSFSRGNLDIELYDDESPFGKLDGFYYYRYNSSISCNFLKENSITAGVTGFHSELLSSDSYFEIWPFTFWDIFLGTKNKLNTFDVDVTMPYSTVDLKYPFKILNFKIDSGVSLSYYHIIFSNKIIYAEKVWVSYPFVSKYESTEEDIEIKYDGVIRLQGNLSVRYYDVELSFYVSQLVPVDFSSLFEKAKETGVKEKNISGGTYLYFSVNGFY